MPYTMTDLGEGLLADEMLALLGHSQYNPTRENMARMAAGFIADPAVAILACKGAGAVAGLMVLRREADARAEILGIAVQPALRGQGVGWFMVDAAMRDWALDALVAETDDDAVDFYRRCGFLVTPLDKKIEGCPRYLCVRTAQ